MGERGERGLRDGLLRRSLEEQWAGEWGVERGTPLERGRGREWEGGWVFGALTALRGWIWVAWREGEDEEGGRGIRAPFFFEIRGKV